MGGTPMLLCERPCYLWIVRAGRPCFVRMSFAAAHQAVSALRCLMIVVVLTPRFAATIAGLPLRASRSSINPAAAE